MVRYAGPHIGDEKPLGGGEHNKNHLGHEAFNFRNFGGNLYGSIQPKSVDLLKVDPTASKKTAELDNVTIIFVAPYEFGQRVVGWYKGAVLYRERQDYPARVKEQLKVQLEASIWRKEADTFKSFRAAAPFARAVLLPEDERMGMPPIPRTELGGFGEYNVCYLYKDGKRKDVPWIKRVMSFVKTYKGRNLLREDHSVKEAALATQERIGGFQSNPAIRKLIETRAMEIAKSELETRGYGDFDDTSKRECYDYTCRKNGKQFFVEVKGTQTRGVAVILTRNEVAHADEHPDNSIMVIVHDLRVKDGDHPMTEGGKVDVRERWRLKREDLTPLQYLWKVPRIRQATGGGTTDE